MDWANYETSISLRGAFLGGMLNEPPWNNPWFIEQGRRQIIKEVGQLDQHFTAAKTPYVAGATFTVADIPIGWSSIAGSASPTSSARNTLPWLRTMTGWASARPIAGTSATGFPDAAAPPHATLARVPVLGLTRRPCGVGSARFAIGRGTIRTHRGAMGALPAGFLADSVNRISPSADHRRWRPKRAS